MLASEHVFTVVCVCVFWVCHISMEVPVLWLRVDPEFQWLRQLSVEQPDTVWQSMLKYERDAVAQIEVSHEMGGGERGGREREFGGQ